MRVTKKLAMRIYNAVLTAKKKHKAVSLECTEFEEWCNMVNVLNMVGRDQTSILGYMLDKYNMPSKFEDMILPIEISFSGDKYGTNIMSTEYAEYSPVKGGFITEEEWKTAVEEAGHKGLEFKNVVKQASPVIEKVGNFRLWLTPDEFNTLGSLILSTFKGSTAEDQFTSVDSYKTFGSVETYGDRLTTSSELVRRTTTDYYPIDSSFDLYVKSQYRDDKEDMVIEWTKSVADAITSSK